VVADGFEAILQRFLEASASNEIDHLGRDAAAFELVSTMREMGSPSDERGIEALLTICEEEHRNLGTYSSHPRALWESAGEALREVGLPVDRLGEWLRGGTKEQKLTAADILHRYPDASTLDALVACSRDRDDVVAMHATEALAEAANPNAQPTLLELLHHPERYVREAAAEGLSRIGDPDALADLVETLTHDSDWRPRRAAAEAVGKLAGRTTVKALKKAAVKALKKARRDQTDVATAAKSALEEIEGSP
jgi:HEAT repeat protein